MLFYKSSSGGNDFILLEERHFSQIRDKSSFIRDICERHGGVGGDGLIVFREYNGKVDFSIFNRDGSKAELSGNGMSGLASLLFLTGRFENRVTLSTDSGPRDIELISREKNIFRLRVEIGEPDFSNRIFFPFLENNRLKYSENGMEFYPVSVGNPHAVILLYSGNEKIDFEKTGRLMENSAVFPKKANVEFVILTGKKESDSLYEVRPVFFERGVGITMSSSTGSAAIFAVLRKLGIVKDRLTVITKKSRTVLSGKNSIHIENSTEIVYKGTYLKNEKYFF